MNYKLLWLSFLFIHFPAMAKVEEVKKIKKFFSKISQDISRSTSAKKSIFDNRWYGSSEVERELVFREKNGDGTCLHLRKNKITVYHIKKDDVCVTRDGYSMSFVNYSFRGVLDSGANKNLRLYAIEINASSKFFFLPLLNSHIDEANPFRKWSTPASRGVISGVKFLE